MDLLSDFDPLLNDEITVDDFEEETGEVDPSFSDEELDEEEDYY